MGLMRKVACRAARKAGVYQPYRAVRHPVRALEPRPVQKLVHGGYIVTHPVGAAKNAVENSLLDATLVGRGRGGQERHGEIPEVDSTEREADPGRPAKPLGGRGPRTGQPLSRLEQQERKAAEIKRWEGHVKTMPESLKKVGSTHEGAANITAAMQSLYGAHAALHEKVFEQLNQLPDEHFAAMHPLSRESLASAAEFHASHGHQAAGQLSRKLAGIVQGPVAGMH